MMRDMTYLSTFTGIGGMDLGFDRAGMRCLGMCEIDPAARSVLDRHWPEVPKHDDITTAIDSGWADQFIGRVDVLIGGAPCQDLSIAGKRAGYGDGDRSVLYFDQIDLAQYVQARWVVYENVPGLLTSAGGYDYAAALHYMAEAGYPHVEWRVLDSAHFGVPQRRKRVFTLGCSGDLGGREVLTEPEGLQWHPRPVVPSAARPAGDAEGGAGVGRRGLLADTGVVQTLTTGLASGGPDAQHAQAGWLIPMVDDVPTALQVDTFQMQGFGHYIEAETASTIQSRDYKMATDLIVTCEVACVNCGNDIGPHHVCTDCLQTIGEPVLEES
jgi:DNA (cytosine-5)-methyltransferase 1